MTVDIGANLKTFLDRRAPGARYASFDYCFNYFQEAREASRTEQLANDDRLFTSCLQVGFYLASWGMLRPSGDLLQRSAREFAPVVELIAAEPATTWQLDLPSYATATGEVLALGRRVRKAFGVDVSDTLITKTMLDVFGCVPAFDRYFRIGFGCHSLCEDALSRIGRFYERDRDKIDAYRVFTPDFVTGDDTERQYTKAKIIDMIFFEEGRSLDADDPESPP